MRTSWYGELGSTATGDGVGTMGRNGSAWKAPTPAGERGSSTSQDQSNKGAKYRKGDRRALGEG